MQKLNSKKMAMIGATAAIYAVLTVAMAPISYGAVQLRLSEVMTLLAFVDPVFIPGLVLGNFIANLFSPFGLPDVVFGTLATFIAVFMMSKMKSMLIASFWPTIANGLIIGLELAIFTGAPFVSTALYVALGEFLVVTVLGYPVFKVVMKNKTIQNLTQVTD
ncbi:MULTISPECIES: QueT transporter family protein [Acetoanaerobium]|uniref:Citrulline cluster-linked protein n=1 Tax=Acetoanaerobium sticklandii (strain ATCC 12662 / DSM 519 / JCM 1433 / CCUG 9281 / NCIMB 10654 / HF) TaxID=499177 RepID=E3PUA2_ACESD|nr:QueT transporter family protein [Acetoanaerobium sticklandii]CBH20363.1 Citrulline cluster-linked gene [Acetoanaerobium sticklandii]